MSRYQKEVAGLRDYLIKRVLKEIPYSRLNGSHTSRISNNAHFTFYGVNGEDLLIKLDESGIAASTGSACSAKKQKSSHVLKAMGLDYGNITGSLRLSLGMQNTKEEIDRTVTTLSSIVQELRALSPFKKNYSL
jgi:cysteine desulfurase